MTIRITYARWLGDYLASTPLPAQSLERQAADPRLAIHYERLNAVVVEVKLTQNRGA